MKASRGLGVVPGSVMTGELTPKNQSRPKPPVKLSAELSAMTVKPSSL